MLVLHGRSSVDVTPSFVADLHRPKGRTTISLQILKETQKILLSISSFWVYHSVSLLDNSCTRSLSWSETASCTTLQVPAVACARSSMQLRPPIHVLQHQPNFVRCDNWQQQRKWVIGGELRSVWHRWWINNEWCGRKMQNLYSRSLIELAGHVGSSLFLCILNGSKSHFFCKEFNNKNVVCGNRHFPIITAK